MNQVAFMAIISHKCWGRSAGGRELTLHSNIDINMPGLAPILFIGGTHGDEPEGVELAYRLLDWLVANEHAVTKPWVLIPELNPDGVAAGRRTNDNGVDLNRNYPDSRWCADYSDDEFYPGAHPASEPEIQQVVALIERLQPKIMLHFHSYKPCIVYTGEPGRQVALQLEQVSGYPAVPDIGYPSPGSLGEYGYRDLGIAVICIEEQKGVDHNSIWPRFSDGLTALLV